MSENDRPTLAEVLRDREKVRDAMSRAVRDAVRTHKLLGQPIVTWRDGQVVVLPPEQIPLEPIGEPANHLS